VATNDAKEFLKPAVGLYSGAFVDVVYDHFLANDTSEFTGVKLAETAAATYKVLKQFEHVLPERFRAMLPFMMSQDWLSNYKSLYGTRQSFGGLARRAAYLNDSTEVFSLFEIHYSSLQECYHRFFPDLKQFVLQQLE
jgi:acyl carrier protein phosphodiesterase